MFIQPPSWALHRGPSGVSAVAAQRIVRQAALALKDLHSMAGSMHLDVKVNNLLVGVLCCLCCDFVLLVLRCCFCWC